jgi:hypothetical protein
MTGPGHTHRAASVALRAARWIPPRPELLQAFAFYVRSIERARWLARRMRAVLDMGRVVVGELPNPAAHFSGSNREAGVLEGCDEPTTARKEAM